MTKKMLVSKLAQNPPYMQRPDTYNKPSIPNIPEGQNVHPDGGAFPLPKANKKNKYWRGTPKPIPNAPKIRGVTGKYT